MFSLKKISVLALVLGGWSSCSSVPQGPENQVLFETSGNLETIVFLGTNDIHGALSPEKLKTADDRPRPYNKGGASILASHIKVLRSEFASRLVWLDGGDQFQGSIESNLAEGAPMVDFFNTLGMSAAAIGNHEFDFGAGKESTSTPTSTFKLSNTEKRKVLTERIRQAKYPYLSANVFDKKTGKYPGIEGTQPSVLLNAGRLKVGVIGLTTQDTPVTTRPVFVSDLEFRDLAQTTIQEAAKLRKQGAHIIIALMHEGTVCNLAEQTGKTIKTGAIKSETDVQSLCNPKYPIHDYIRKLPTGTIDGIVSGHTHQVVHHWIDGVPVIESGTRNQYYNLLYLTYDWSKGKVVKERTRIEGPVPICEEIFENQGNCNGSQTPPKNGRGLLATPYLHGKRIEPDPETESLLKPVLARTEAAKKEVLGKADRRLEHARTEESAMGNMVADAVRESIGADVAIMNNGGIRSGLESGTILYEDVFRMLPFDNFVSKLDLTGKELKTFLKIAESGATGFFPISGMKLRLIKLGDEPWSKDLNSDKKIEPWEMDRLIEAALINGSPIEDNKRYSVATIDFLVQGGDRMGWFMSTIPTHRVTQNAGPVLRDVFISYIKKLGHSLNSEAMPAIDPKNPRFVFEPRPAGKSKLRRQSSGGSKNKKKSQKKSRK
jgi:5'-nucleotidase